MLDKKNKKDKTGSLAIVKPETKIEIEQKISQQDVIELISHKQIKKLEALISESTEKLEKINSKLKDLYDKFEKEVTKEVTKLLSPLLEIMKIEQKIEFKKDTITFYANSTTYNTFMKIDLDKLSTKKSDKHLELDSEKENLQKSIDKYRDDINKVRNDKNSIKNAITEQLLSESDEGRDLLSLVEKAYDQAFPKLLK